jgi:hypothetical protein
MGKNATTPFAVLALPQLQSHHHHRLWGEQEVLVIELVEQRGWLEADLPVEVVLEDPDRRSRGSNRLLVVELVEIEEVAGVVAGRQVAAAAVAVVLVLDREDLGRDRLDPVKVEGLELRQEEGVSQVAAEVQNDFQRLSASQRLNDPQ